MLKPLGYTFLPRWMTERSIYLYLTLLVVASALFYQHAMKWYFICFGIVEVVGFFAVGNLLTKLWRPDKVSVSTFEKRILLLSFSIRAIYVFFSYWFYMTMKGDFFEFGLTDAQFYHYTAVYGAQLIKDIGLWNFFPAFYQYLGTDLSDAGYSTYLSIIYLFTNDSVIVSRLIKALWGALTVLLIYRLAKNTFGEATARVASIFCMLMPNLIYYCGVQLKEVEMVFLTVLMMQQTDVLLRKKKIQIWRFLLILLIGAILFTIRTPLALVAILSILFTIIFSSGKVMGWPSRLLIGLFAVIFIGIAFGSRIENKARSMVENVQKGDQKDNMAWRANRDNGNKFSTYAGAAVFAPLIFTMPFPTLVDIPEQENQQIVHGGNFVKNILSGLVIFAMFSLLISGDWRKCALPLSLALGYLVVLIFSSFAHSERFHQPSLPFELMFAAYGLSLLGKREKRWFNYWLVALFVINIAWQWFKLAGRNML